MISVLVVGAGQMAGEYIKVLDTLNVNYIVVGRSDKSAERFEKIYGKKVLIGGLEKTYETLQNTYTHAVIATTLENLEENALFLLEKGIKNILLEKPGAVTLKGLQRIQNAASIYDANVYIAYNRRFYASVLEARKRIEEDGGLTSFLFEFTEWSHILENMGKTKFQLDNWFIANSTHVLDTAFYFGGEPKEWSGFKQSHLEWHPKGSIFVGAGITKNNIPFSYHANWNAPGSWKLELLTKKNRYSFRPFEELHIQKLGSVVVDKVEIENTTDVDFKPGLYKQIEQFIYNKKVSNLLDIKSAVNIFKWYHKVLGN